MTPLNTTEGGKSVDTGWLMGSVSDEADTERPKMDYEGYVWFLVAAFIAISWWALLVFFAHSWLKS